MNLDQTCCLESLLGIECGICGGHSMQLIIPEFYCCMSNNCNASYALENKKDGTLMLNTMFGTMEVDC